MPVSSIQWPWVGLFHRRDMWHFGKTPWTCGGKGKALSILRRKDWKMAFSLWKHLKRFSFTLCRKNLYTQQSHFGFAFEKNSVRKITKLSWRHHFRKAKLCFKMFSVLTKTSNLSGCEECFVVFSVAGRSNGRKKSGFSNFSGVGNVNRAWMFNALVCFDVLLSFGDSLTFIESLFSGVSKTNFVYSVMLSICVLTM